MRKFQLGYASRTEAKPEIFVRIEDGLSFRLVLLLPRRETLGHGLLEILENWHAALYRNSARSGRWPAVYFRGRIGTRSEMASSNRSIPASLSASVQTIMTTSGNGHHRATCVAVFISEAADDHAGGVGVPWSQFRRRPLSPTGRLNSP